jgi:arylsulfatase A-like enzyme
MTRRSFLGATAALCTNQAQAAVKPNIVFILTDDQGWFDLGANGNPHVETPNIDQLAAEGVRFTHFYASPVCTPTRASLMTGRHYQRTGAVDTFLGRDTLDSRETTMGNVFQQAGYRTACVGKWHLGRYMKYHPNRRGFDEYFGFWQYGFMNRYDDSDELFDNRTPVEVTGYITDVLTDRAIRFVRENRNRPYLLYLAYNAPHSPYLVPDRYIDRYLKKNIPLQDARIYGMLSCIDDNVGRLLQTVDKENTIVVFMGDNGGTSRYFKAGLRGNKGSAYEGGVRVPFIARWPGKLPAGAVTAAMAQHIDVLPTFCELAEIPAPSKLDGKSLAPLLKTGRGESPHGFIYNQWNRGYPVLKTVAGDPELKANWSIRNARGEKLISTGELFDLAKDPGEQHDLAKAEPETAAALQREFERFYADVTKSREYKRVPIEVGRPDENPVEIDLTWGEPVGAKVKPQYRSYNRDTIDNWTETGDLVRWKIDVVEPGDYELILSYGCEPGEEGSVMRTRAGGAYADHKVLPTGGRTVFRPLSAGHLQLSRGPATLEMQPVSIVGKEVMVVHRIWLKRTNATRN